MTSKFKDLVQQMSPDRQARIHKLTETLSMKTWLDHLLKQYNYVCMPNSRGQLVLCQHQKQLCEFFTFVHTAFNHAPPPDHDDFIRVRDWGLKTLKKRTRKLKKT